MEFIHGNLTYAVIGAAMEVHSNLGYGFLEDVYEKALIHELLLQGFDVKTQLPISVNYKDIVVGNYIVDMLINDILVVELKAINNLNQKHAAQTINYLVATNKEIGLLLNFGTTSLQHTRLINQKRKNLYSSK